MDIKKAHYNEVNFSNQSYIEFRKKVTELIKTIIMK